MNGIKTMFTSGNLLALIVFLVVLLIAAVLVGVLCKSLPVGLGVFSAGAVVLVVLFMIAGLWELRVDFATINLHIPLVTLWICSTVT